MAITYGYFNSLNGDRKYNAAQMSEYFDGLVSDGVYESVGGAMQVQAATGMNVNVQTGRAIIDCKWIKNDAVLTLPITSSHVTLNRYTAVFIRLNYTDRDISIIAVDGTPATTPTKPQPTNTSTIKDMCVAYIYVAAGATAIRQADITDQRGTDLCGWVTGLIKQVDTSTLFAQWSDACAAFYADMTAGFNAWFATLTGSLNVNTYIREFRKDTRIESSQNVIQMDMDGYVYDASDIIHVYINGLLGVQGEDYTIDPTAATSTITTITTENGTQITISVLKSEIGFYALGTSDNYLLVTDQEEALET